MRAEPWMDRTPIPTRTPLQIAEADVRHWSSRVSSLEADLTEAQRRWIEARDLVEKLEQQR